MAAVFIGLALASAVSRSDPHGLAMGIGLYAAAIGSGIAMVGYGIRWISRFLLDPRLIPEPTTRSRALSRAGFSFTLAVLLMMAIGGIGATLAPDSSTLAFAAVGVLTFVIGLVVAARALYVAVKAK